VLAAARAALTFGQAGAGTTSVLVEYLDRLVDHR
jgi:hypothetical protein